MFNQTFNKQAELELGLTQAETVSLELGRIKGWTNMSYSYSGANLTGIFAAIAIKV